MRVAIHQPDFFPWLGLFHKVRMSDKFVFFDHVQAPRGKSWMSRNKILLNGDVRWLTIPIKRKGKGYQKYYEVLINYGSDFERKHLGTIRQAYIGSPYFKAVYPIVEGLYKMQFDKLVDFNKECIQTISQKLDFDIVFQSSTDLVNENPDLDGMGGNDLVLQTCIQAGATEYVSGMGCLDFIQPAEFKKHGIEFYFQKFVHPEYSQKNNSDNAFVSHLSSLDALFNLGFKGVKDLIAEDMLEPA